MKITFATIVVLVIVWESHQQCLGPTDNDTPNPTARLGLYTGQQDFSLGLLNAVNKLMQHDNLFFSPYSTYHALLVAYFLAGNQTENYLKKTLRLNPTQSKSDIGHAYKVDKLATSINAINASYEFTNANKIYVSDKVPVRDCIKTYFHDELEITPFAQDPEGARTNINNWVETQTHNMIKDLLPPGSIDKDSNLVLVNAAYFKGVWLNKFNPNATKPDIFYVNPTKQIMVDMMHVEGTFNHDVSESLGAHILELPYQGDQISMYIFLPPFAKEDAIDTTLKQLTLEKFKAIVENRSLTPKTVDVSLPKFTLEHTIELVPILESLGVGNLFQDDADFSTLSNQKHVSVGRGIHKAKIELNEIGAKAAAATAIIDFRIMDEQFNCNRPFIFFIYNKIQHTILFSGVFRKPT